MEVRSALGPLPRGPGACSPTHACRLVRRPRAGLLSATTLAGGGGLTMRSTRVASKKLISVGWAHAIAAIIKKAPAQEGGRAPQPPAPRAPINAMVRLQ